MTMFRISNEKVIKNYLITLSIEDQVYHSSEIIIIVITFKYEVMLKLS